jgi:hypothetical protein
MGFKGCIRSPKYTHFVTLPALLSFAYLGTKDYFVSLRLSGY